LKTGKQGRLNSKERTHLVKKYIKPALYKTAVAKVVSKESVDGIDVNTNSSQRYFKDRQTRTTNSKERIHLVKKYIKSALYKAALLKLFRKSQLEKLMSNTTEAYTLHQEHKL
jgi:hypothetical protein